MPLSVGYHESKLSFFVLSRLNSTTHIRAHKPYFSPKIYEALIANSVHFEGHPCALRTCAAHSDPKPSYAYTWKNLSTRGRIYLHVDHFAAPPTLIIRAQAHLRPIPKGLRVGEEGEGALPLTRVIYGDKSTNGMKCLNVLAQQFQGACNIVMQFQLFSCCIQDALHIRKPRHT